MLPQGRRGSEIVGALAGESFPPHIFCRTWLLLRAPERVVVFLGMRSCFRAQGLLLAHLDVSLQRSMTDGIGGIASRLGGADLSLAPVRDTLCSLNDVSSLRRAPRKNALPSISRRHGLAQDVEILVGIDPFI